jgi:uncharacterized glyoxalase superfamily protein PhnB
MQDTPDGWPRISSALFYDDPAAAIAWLCRVFGFEVRLIVERGDGQIAHSELVLGEGLIMVGAAGGQPFCRSPRSVDGNTQSLMVFVDDVEAHCAHARAAGAQIVREPAVSDYGDEYWADRAYQTVDCEGHYWWFAQRLRTGSTDWSKVRNKVDKEP